MIPLLKNPVYHSLLLNDRHLGSGSEKVKFFHEDVSPFAGFEEGYENGFSELYEMLPPGRTILYATPRNLQPPFNWKMLVSIEGLQFLHDGKFLESRGSFQPVRLTQEHVPQMIELARLTKPGPFDKRTIEFSNYFGVFEDHRLVAMTGQRMHIENYTEVSAVCTHPGHLGKGYASALVQHQVNLILSHQQIPFLHVRVDNRRAIELYERLGFKQQGVMNFYFFRK